MPAHKKDGCKRLRGFQLDLETGKALAPEAKKAKAGDSQLATRLLTLWTEGRLSATCVQELAHLAMLEKSIPELAILAKCGNYGQVPGNISRDISTNFLKEQGICPPYKIRVKCLGRNNAIIEDDMLLFLPHLMFAHLANNYAESFPSLFPSEGLETFWEQTLATRDDRLVEHPLKKGQWKKKLHPLFLHGDGVAYESRDTLMTWSFGSVLASDKPTMEAHFLMACYPKSSTCNETWPKVWDYLHWSFECLAKGLHPTCDPYGKPLKQGDPLYEYAGEALTPQHWKAAVWNVIGDHEFFSNTLKLPHWAAKWPCWACDAHRDNFKSLKFEGHKCVDASLAIREPVSEHPLFTLAGVTSRNVKHDMLHVLYVNGVLSHVMGSLLRYACWFDKPGGHQKVAPAQRLSILFTEIQKEYTANKVASRLTNLTLSMFCNPKQPHATYPMLHCKGGECKHLVKPLLAVLRKMLGKGRPIHNNMLSCLQSISDLIDLWDSCEMFLSSSEWKKSMKLHKDFVQEYKLLGEWAWENDRYLFHVVAKHHTMWHMCLDSRHQNPRFNACWKGEDFVGKISLLCHSCSFGVKCTRLTTKVLPKYQGMLHLILTRNGMDWEACM